ncbi:TIGR00730 family Rossman fold protein [Sporichthya brevicatena]|uniref:Cytokinin riboside 5'-monophosphate phosphoribohydrolase n=1 Tax=Sporichthya brevicatena TaxID=171442 RepID=A0ABN1G3N0_9ACTN
MARICVFCSSSETIAAHYVALGTEVGEAIAARGHSLVSGGGSVSTMGTLARAARAGGAHTTGVIPEALIDWEGADHEADELIVTPDVRSRKGEMDARSDAFLVLPGGIGTLEELLEIWVSRVLAMHHRPVVVLDPDGLYAPLRDQVRLLLERGFLRTEAAEVLQWATTAEEAFDRIEAELAAGPENPPPAAGELLEAEP